ncbi:MAG: DNA-3-methyladenine glycosylase 2 family protein, partial [Clostridia bacterium]|nr:DNA-3-methyladenine glycosylase 2 family protein [Clostridia bacterium]
MKNNFIIPLPKTFDLSLCLDCGQAFRWQKDNSKWHGVAYGKHITIEQAENELIFYNCTEEDFNSIWKNYFDLDCDYEKIVSEYDDNYLMQAVKEYNGIRILRQEPWEALCSFIISQNNNIPRIKGIIERLCEEFGEGESGRKSFPSAIKLASLTVEDLAPLRAGFRAKYIIDAAQKVANGEIDFEKIANEPIEFGREELQKIKGVGAKVAECTL